jgi:hypothetical protein
MTSRFLPLRPGLSVGRRKRPHGWSSIGRGGAGASGPASSGNDRFLKVSPCACHATGGEASETPSTTRGVQQLAGTVICKAQARDLHPGGRLVFHVFAALAEFIRELIVTGTREGLAAARERGRVGGRPSVVTPDLIRAARDLLPNPEHSITSIAKLLSVSPGTLYNHIPDLQELRDGAVAKQLDAK